MRARNIDEFIGQKHIVGTDSLIRRALKVNRLGSCIFYGPPGVGKTTLAYIIAQSLNLEYVKLNAVSSGVAEAKKVIESAKKNFEFTGKSTMLILDECHRWSKAQSDCVLEAIERGYITFIGTTTENPHVSMTPAIVSRCRLFKFKPLELEDVTEVNLKAVAANKKATILVTQINKGNLSIVSDSGSAVLNLQTGLNEIEILVTAENGVSNVYKVTITK